MASREWVGRDVIAMGEIDPGFAVCPRAQQHLHPRDHPSPTTLFHVALQPDSTLRALSPLLPPSPSLYRSLSLLLVGSRGVRASRTFPADFSRGESASDARIVSWGWMGKGRTVGLLVEEMFSFGSNVRGGRVWFSFFFLRGRGGEGASSF